MHGATTMPKVRFPMMERVALLILVSGFWSYTVTVSKKFNEIGSLQKFVFMETEVKHRTHLIFDVTNHKSKYHKESEHYIFS